MNVLEALKQYDGYRLKVGCADGNSYWYVGTVADFKKEINAYNAELLNYSQEMLDTAKRKFNAVLKRSVTPNDYIRDELAHQTVVPEDWKVTLEGYYAYLQSYFYEVAAKRSTVSQRQQRLLRYIPLRKREVVKCFVADTVVEPTSCVVITIEGKEPGAFWSTDEAKQLPSVGFRKEDASEENAG